jgi:hypothetical protein
MPFLTTTQANRTRVAKAVQLAEIATRPTRNGANLRGIRNDVSDAQADATMQELANAVKAAGYTAV